MDDLFQIVLVYKEQLELVFFALPIHMIHSAQELLPGLMVHALMTTPLNLAWIKDQFAKVQP